MPEIARLMEEQKVLHSSLNLFSYRWIVPPHHKLMASAKRSNSLSPKSSTLCLTHPSTAFLEELITAKSLVSPPQAGHPQHRARSRAVVLLYTGEPL